MPASEPCSSGSTSEEHCTVCGAASATGAAESGVPREVAERALAHVVKGATESAYHTTDLIERRRELMQRWADYLTNPNA